MRVYGAGLVDGGLERRGRWRGSGGQAISDNGEELVGRGLEGDKTLLVSRKAGHQEDTWKVEGCTGTDRGVQSCGNM